MPHPGRDQSMAVERRSASNYAGNILVFLGVQSQQFDKGTFEAGEIGTTS